MHHEEKIIDGKLCWRSHSSGLWVEYSKEQLTKKLLDAASNNKDLYEKAPWWTNPDIPPMKVT